MKFLLVFSILGTFSSSSANEDDVSGGGSNASSCVAPPPFDDASLESIPAIRMVMSITTGDYFVHLVEGARMQAQVVGGTGIDFALTSSGGDDGAGQARLVSDAASLGGVVGILTVGGHADEMCGAIDGALSNNVTVVSFDFGGGACSPSHVLAAQDNRDMARLVLGKALVEEGGDVDVGYVSDLNYEPLIPRDEVWEEYKTNNGWNQVFFVNDAANYTNAEDLKSAIETAIAGSPRPPRFIYAPWDYLSINAVTAIAAAADGSSSGAAETRVYGADVNDEDIAVITSPGSVWMATAGGGPLEIGASLVRMVALSMAGELSGAIAVSEGGGEGTTIEIPIALITRDFLVTNDVTNMDTLGDVMPELLFPDFVRACWIGSVEDVPPPESTTTDDLTSASSVVDFMMTTMSLAFPLALSIRLL